MPFDPVSGKSLAASQYDAKGRLVDDRGEVVEVPAVNPVNPAQISTHPGALTTEEAMTLAALLVKATGQSPANLKTHYDNLANAAEASRVAAEARGPVGLGSFTADASGGTQDVIVTASGPWNASSGSSFVKVSPASGVGNGKVTVTVEANSGAARTASVTINGQAFGVSQRGA